jgi:hypothetical protein
VAILEWIPRKGTRRQAILEFRNLLFNNFYLILSNNSSPHHPTSLKQLQKVRHTPPTTFACPHRRVRACQRLL